MIIIHHADSDPDKDELISNCDTVSRIMELVRDGETVRVKTTYHGEYLTFSQECKDECDMSIEVEISDGNGIYLVMSLVKGREMKLYTFEDYESEPVLWLNGVYANMEIGLETIKEEKQ